jgi:lipoprotein NlpD
VVYSGSGLPGYGYLIIIKHNNIYLSAYAHNSAVLVKEGQKVKAGQTIARMGNTGADKVMLHFEIRRRGQPIDPETVLPKR